LDVAVGVADESDGDVEIGGAGESVVEGEDDWAAYDGELGGGLGWLTNVDWGE
jgi:hypothetical protein